MLFMFPKFSPVEIIPSHFETVNRIIHEAGVTQVSHIHMSFLAWRGDELVQPIQGPGYPTQYKFEPAPTDDDPHRRVLRGQVVLKYQKTIPAWNENPRWNT